MNTFGFKESYFQPSIDKVTNLQIVLKYYIYFHIYTIGYALIIFSYDVEYKDKKSSTRPNCNSITSNSIIDSYLEFIYYLLSYFGW